MHENDDFNVYQHGKNSLNDVLNFLSRLEKGLHLKDIERRKEKNQTTESFLLNTALTATSAGKALYRKNSQADEFLTSTWMALVKNRADRIRVTHRVRDFTAFSDDELRALAKISTDVKNLKYLPEYIAKNFGVILIIEPYFQTMKTDGCAMRLDSGVPVIGLSLRYNRYDSFWFTLMHEMSHVALHYDDLSTPIIDDLDDYGEDESEKETEANRLAIDSLVPRNVYRKMMLEHQSKERLFEHAKNAQIHPSIAAGLIRHKTKNYKIYSHLVNEINVASELGVER